MSLTINNTSQALTNGASQKSCEVNQQLLSRTESKMGHKKVKELDQEDTETCGKVQLLVCGGNHKPFPSQFPFSYQLQRNGH